jgi:hypothetical protein
MNVAYVAGPYRSNDGPYGITQNILRARDAAVVLWQQGYAVICPHLNTAMMDGAAPDSVWLKGDLEIMRRCDLVVLVEGWEQSTGTLAEIEEAKRLKLPIYEWIGGILVRLHLSQ